MKHETKLAIEAAIEAAKANEDLAQVAILMTICAADGDPFAEADLFHSCRAVNERNSKRIKAIIDAIEAQSN